MYILQNIILCLTITGTFYIRGSSKVDHYALSVHISTSSPRVEHYLVHDNQDGKFLFKVGSIYPHYPPEHITITFVSYIKIKQSSTPVRPVYYIRHSTPNGGGGGGGGGGSGTNSKEML